MKELEHNTMTPLSRDESHADTTTLFGFWLYLMTDFILFASLFAVFAVLRGNTFGGPSGGDIFSLPLVLAGTLILLASSFTCGLALLSARLYRRAETSMWLVATAALGVWFVVMEFSEFTQLIAEGFGWERSAFLSAFFTLVGTHGLHVTIGIIWILAIVAALYFQGFSRANLRKLFLFTIFWHFLDIIWIFIFTFVYLFGIL
ncbi:MAG: cytochrome o ubiquinol oxidase subunit [Candidatus Parcubacteria bacterium]|jgi:cytochrome o ubiquinol oxidase subunit 3